MEMGSWIRGALAGYVMGEGDGADVLRELQGLGKREDSISGFTGHSLI